MKLFSFQCFFLASVLFVSCSSTGGNKTDGGQAQAGGVDTLYFAADTLALASFKDYEAGSGTQIGKSIEVDSAAVSCAHPEAARVGLDILRKGGNAVDAAIAIQLALAVVYPKAGNIGGGGFMVSRFADGKVVTLDYREKAPSKASRDMYLDKNKNVIDNLSVSGHLACGVPGTIDGLITAHQYGKLPFKDLIQPAIDLAEKGFKLTRRDANSFNKYAKDIKKYNRYTPAIISKTDWESGDLFVQSDLAETLKRVRDNGRDGFYKGKTADLIVAEMKAGKGLITLSDLENYHTQVRKPVEFKYKDYDIISMGPPSSGGVCLGEMMGMIEDKNIGKLKFHTPASIHMMAEAERRAYADRAKYLGDPDFWKVPQKGMLDKKYLKSRFKNFDPDQATPSEKIAAGDVPESEQTTHLSVIDAQGNCVSVTTTINSNFGSKVVVKGAGFFLNNEMDDFSAKPGEPNQFGLIGAEANAIAPNKRMLSAMTPTIVLKNKKPVLIVGTPGGATIITSVFQVILNVIEFDMPLEKAVNAKRFHMQWKPDKISIEEGAFDKKTIEALKKMGHKIDTREAIGLVDAIHIRSDGKIVAVGDRRSDDTAAGY